MGIFGWDYPPGCSGPPEQPDPHPKSEEMQELLEAENVSQETIDKACQIVEELALAAERECPVCLDRWAKEQQESVEQFDMETATEEWAAANPENDEKGESNEGH